MRCCVFAFTVVLLLGCSGSSDGDPQRLFGVWRTDAPSYAGRHLEIRPDSLTFGQGEGAVDRNLITSIEWDPPFRDETRFVLTYASLDDDLARELVVFVHETEPPTLRLANQDLRWKREPPRSSRP